MRWSGPFPSPNIAAMECAITLLGVMICGSFLSTSPRSVRHIALSIVLYAACIACITGIVFSGSRAGLLSLLVGMIVLLSTKSVSFKAAALVCTGTVLLELVSPFVWRFIPLHPDGSAESRLILWRGALSLIHDHMWTGIGSKHFYNAMNRWYLAGHRNDHFITAQNDALTLTAFWGLPTLGVCGGVLGAMVVQLWVHARNGSRLAAFSVAAIACQLVAGIFQANWFSGYPIIYMSWTVVILVGLPAFCRPVNSYTMLYGFVTGCLCSAGVIAALAAWHVTDRSSWRTAFGPDRSEYLAFCTPELVDSKLLVVFGTQDATDVNWRTWVDVCHRFRTNILEVQGQHDRHWWKDFMSFCSKYRIEPLVLGAGNHGSEVYDLWNKSWFDHANVIVFDPVDLPLPSRDSAKGQLSILAGRWDPFIDVDVIQHETQGLTDIRFLVRPDHMVGWWSYSPEMLFDLTRHPERR